MTHRYEVFARSGADTVSRGHALTLDEAVTLAHRAHRFEEVWAVDLRASVQVNLPRHRPPTCGHLVPMAWDDEAERWVVPRGRCIPCLNVKGIETVEVRV